MSDRHGNPHFTDAQQVETLVDILRADGFTGTEAQLTERAEAWWWSGREFVPTLEWAREFNRTRRGGQ